MKNQESIANQIWMFFCSVKLTVYTLVLLAVTSIIGTVVLQNGSPQQYIDFYGPGMTNLIHVLDINDMYHAWWFLLLLVLLCINITVCSVERLSITWKTIFPKQLTFSPNRYLKSRNRENFERKGPRDRQTEQLEALLARKVGKVLKKEDGDTLMLYAEKGRWTRIGVYVVHASVLLLLLGALIGAVFGFKANLRLDEGETADTVFTAKTRTPLKLPFEVRCNDFEVQFYDTGAPELFRSNLTVIEDGQERFTADITMNNPLRYRGINIFQSSYGTGTPDAALFSIVDNRTGGEISRTIKIGETIDLPDGKGTFLFQGFLPHFDFKGHNLGEAFFGMVTLAGEQGRQIGLPVKFPTFDKMRKGRFAFVVKDFEKRYYTGLQVTKDPGVWYVYTGFVLMILGCWVTFFMSHQAYFVAIRPGSAGASEIVVAGSTNRSRQSMKLHLEKFVKQINAIPPA